MIRTRAGFTLIELMTVTAILGILAALSFPRVAATRDKAKIAALRADLHSAQLSQESYFSSNGQYTDAAQLQSDGLLSLSPGDTLTIAIVPPGGYIATIANGTIQNGPTSCRVRVGSGVPPDSDGVVTCP